MGIFYLMNSIMYKSMLMSLQYNKKLFHSQIYWKSKKTEVAIDCCTKNNNEKKSSSSSSYMIVGLIDSSIGDCVSQWDKSHWSLPMGCCLLMPHLHGCLVWGYAKSIAVGILLLGITDCTIDSSSIAQPKKMLCVCSCWYLCVTWVMISVETVPEGSMLDMLLKLVHVITSPNCYLLKSVQN